jgi:exosome complex RNA-binding protein Rrp4
MFDFSEAGSVRITAPGFINDLLSNCRETGIAVSPATDHLFEARDSSVAELVGPVDKAYFHSEVAKLLYIAKRIYPEILVAISYLATRVNIVDKDDMLKLTRVHKYINYVRDRGIRLHIGDTITVRAYVDAAYGVHADGKSHTGCMVIVGDDGAVYFKSAKQKIVAKSSTEGELIAGSDSCNVPLHLAEFLRYQGYTVPPVILYQDNKSAIALFARGYSTSDLTKHISIRYFWIKERTDAGEVVIVYCPTAMMFANVLTKPLGGRQFLLERDAVTGWK